MTKMNYTKKRWIVLAASCIINLCIGSVFVWSVFATPMAEHLSTLTGVAYTAGSLAIVFTVCNSYGPIPMIFSGFIINKIGPRALIIISGLLFGAGFLICSMASSVAMLVVGYGILTGVGVGLAYGCTINNSVKFFPDKRGLVGGIATASYGFSSVIVPILANAMIRSMGITATFRCIGIAFALIICICGLFIKKCPDDFVPAGYVPPVMSNGMAVESKNWKQMLCDPAFYVMLLLLTTGCFFGLMIISQASPMAQNMLGMSAGTASLIVSILSLFNVSGRIVCGYISDKIGRINTLAIMLAVAIVGLALLIFNISILTFVVGICLIGVAYGAFLGVYPGFTADRFGPKYNAVNYGFIFTGMAIAGMTAPTAIAKIYSATNSYGPAFICAIILALVGIGLTIVYRILERHRG